jgi:hypothetical protein
MARRWLAIFLIIFTFGFAIIPLLEVSALPTEQTGTTPRPNTRRINRGLLRNRVRTLGGGEGAATCEGNLTSFVWTDTQAQRVPPLEINIRTAAGIDAAWIGRITTDDPVVILSNEIVCEDGYSWRNVRYGTIEGWAVTASASVLFIGKVGDTLPDGTVLGIPGVRSACDIGEINANEEHAFYNNFIQGDSVTVVTRTAGLAGILRFYNAKGGVLAQVDIPPLTEDDITETHIDDFIVPLDGAYYIGVNRPEDGATPPSDNRYELMVYVNRDDSLFDLTGGCGTLGA